MLTMGEIEQRRAAQNDPESVVFAVRALYGLSRKSVSLPLGAAEEIESGQICITLDPEADQTGNVGLIDYRKEKLTVRYAVQAVFPGLYELAISRRQDAGLFSPVRIVATDDCSLTPDLTGWHAFGCLDFLQGSVWSGATGG
jgi:hypothetical protein